MCDTIVVTSDSTAAGATLFGKNSDREPNEAHHLMRIPARDYAQPSRVKCTYIEIPQVEHTYEVLLAKPFWMWGAEMGANEHGMVIGNEAVFTKVPYQREGGLLGMDLLRLALERAESSRQALAVMTDLLGQWGQGGNCGFTGRFYYHNSFLIADPQDAWLLETAGPHWVAKQIRGVYSISNGFTITNDFDLSSSELVSHAIERRWCSNEADFSFADCYGHRILSRLSSCEYRRSRSTANLRSRTDITAVDIMSALRDHGDRPDPRLGLVKPDVCMHAGAGRIRRSQTTGSMVSSLMTHRPLHFLTGTAAPCTSLFKPVWTDLPIPDTGIEPKGIFSDDNLYWQHEKLHRKMLKDLPGHLGQFVDVRDQFESEMMASAMSVNASDDESRHTVSKRFFERSLELESQFLRDISDDSTDSRSRIFKRRWAALDRGAEFQI